jgi:amino acid adenylation domain-containing protein
MQFSTLSQLLQQRASESPEGVAYVYLPDGEETEQRITYGQLDRRAKAVAAELQSFTVRGERAVLLFPPGLDFIVALFGCFYSGVIAVPAYPPKLSRRNRSDNRIESIIKDAQPSAILSLSMAMEQVPGIRWVAIDEVTDALEADWKDPQASETDLAFLQYTSGSTSAPKGVMLTHANILHNERMIQTACQHTEASTFVGWLPLYHDMGLIGNVLQPLYLGAKSVLMPPNAFLQKPVRWLSAITRYQARTSGGPNFAYDLCVRKITAEQKEDLDLRSWTVAFNGAEPVRQETLDRFTRAFAGCGFRSSAFYPCYGLAETSLIVSGGTITAEPLIRRLDVRALETGHVEQSNKNGTRTFVGCGAPVVDTTVSIVNPETGVRAKPGELGEIWVSSPSVASGYWGREEATEQTFKRRLNGEEKTYLRTRDCGFMLDGQLFITGRLQDMIIIRGQNYHPEDIEWTIQQTIPIHTSAAFSVDEASEERLVVLVEVDHRKDINLDDLVRSVRYAVAEQHEIQVAVVGLVKVGTLPKTSSGKIQRHICKQRYLVGTLELLACDRLGERTAAPESLTRERLISAHKDKRRLLVEQFLQARVCGLVRAEQIDPAHPLIALGLDSLSAIELTTIVETQLGIRVSLESALSGASLSDIASSILAQIEDSLPEDSSELVRVANLEYPLSYAQQASWVLYKKDPENASHVMARAARIDGALDPAALEHAFQKITLRHPCLRTTFAEREGRPLQIVRESASLAFTVADAQGISEENLLARMKADVNRPFNLETGPIFRVHLYKRSLTQHYLVLSLHHIVCDLWSFGLILNELGPTYAGETSGLPAPSASYEDFVAWQESMTKSNAGMEHWAYWQQELAGELPVLDLPVDYERPASGIREAAELHFHFPKTLRDDLAQLAKQNQCTMYVLLLTAFQVLLHRYSGQDDVIIGAPASGRDQERWSNLVGYFANTITLRSTLAAGERFTDALARTRKKVIGALTHQQFPFPLLVERLQPVRETNRAPLFQVLFVFQNIANTHQQALQKFALGEAGAQVQIGDLKMESVPVEHTASEYDLILTLAEVEGGIGCLFKYSTDLFNKATATRIIKHFENLLTEIVEHATAPVPQLSLLDDAEERQLIFDWPRNDTPFAQGESLVTLFARRVAQRPDAIALEHEGSQLSYEKLDARANQMAHHLMKMGVGPDVCVAVCLERSLDLIEAILGIVKAGGAYVPLDPAYPLERLSYIIEDARAAVLICEQQIATSIAVGWTTQVVCLDEDRETIEQESVLRVSLALDDHNLAYVTYTSGSTGTPKGVAVTHRNVVRLVNESTFVKWHTDDIYLQLAPVAFDASTFEIWGSLLNGCRLNVHPPNSPSLQELGEFIQRQRVTVLWLTAGLFDEMVEWEIDRLKPVRQLLAGGDALSVRSVKKVLYELPECKLINGYGPTESTTFASTCDLRTAYKWNGTVPIGRPIANTQTYVVDGAQQVLPVGVYGELCIGGAGLARGYLDRPELTAERFVPHPYSNSGGARLYRTGDVVRWNADGQLEFRGRADHQVKVRGYRIELGEVEAALRSCSGVKQAVVVAREQQLVGYVVIQGRNCRGGPPGAPGSGVDGGGWTGRRPPRGPPTRVGAPVCG